MSQSEETITVNKKAYYQLLEDSAFLDALRAAGVDNWEGYEYAQEFCHGDDQDEDF